MDQPDERETTSTGVTRSQSVVYTLPHDWNAIPQFLAPALERLDASDDGPPQLLVLTADTETTVAVAHAALRLAGANGPTLAAITSARRGARIIKDGTVAAIAGTPQELAALVSGSTLKLASVRTVIVAWADEMLDAADPAQLETIMSELPKDAERVLVTSGPSDEVDQFIERYMRKPRRAGGSTVPEDAAPAALQYVSVAPSARASTLRRLLDELDPPAAAVVARTTASRDEARAALRALGYRDDRATAMVTDGVVAQNTSLVVFFDVPAERAELDRALEAKPVQVLVLAQPRQLAHLRALANGGRVSAFVLPETATKARRRDEKVREQLRAQLVTGVPPREVHLLEPLLEEYDGVEIAAAAMRLLERERERSASLMAGTHTGAQPKGTNATAGLGGATAGSGAWKRLFLTIGEVDKVRGSDLVAAIVSTAGVTADQVGKADIRDNHTLIEVAAGEAESIAAKLNGVIIRGRKIVARMDQDKATRDSAGTSGPGGGAPRSSFSPQRGGGDRPDRSRGAASFDRDRPARPAFDRGDRPTRPAFDRGDRPARPAFDRGDRPVRPSFDRSGPPSRGPSTTSGSSERPARPSFSGGSKGGERGASGFDRGDRGGPPARGGAGRGGASGSGSHVRGAREGAGGTSGGGGGYRRDEAPPVERAPRAATERNEWAERASRMRNASRPPRPRPDAE